ncbi:hypothetical protein GGI25_006441 [Coemansia spiralis]|uniref:Uncharacterized protein n=2 Tax=Coemansia TaxID=4863 RepID=A0A9W8KTQ2_9FUNG|nr:hypothetical protein EDC05_006454 [Coemansia umbellata]KAJ2618587.1 hypothetical protein GGI26_006488 [Coemansia sp. RSA 1358]KAJ2668465.1 hypothetical protein GGI25_006441 [Coemansia spiralis]
MNNYNRLPSLKTAEALCDIETIPHSKIKDLFNRNGMTDNWGLWLPHRHRRLNDNEVMLVSQEPATLMNNLFPSSYSKHEKWFSCEFDNVPKDIPNKEFFEELESIIAHNKVGIKYLPNKKKYMEISTNEGETLTEVDSLEEYPNSLITLYKIADKEFEGVQGCWVRPDEPDSMHVDHV